MKHLFIPFELATIAKEKGFNEDCFGYIRPDNTLNLEYDYIFCTNDLLEESENCTAPLYSQIIDWFRETHKINVWVQLYGNSFKQRYVPCTMKGLNPNNTKEYNYNTDFYEALTKAIEEAFKLI